MKIIQISVIRREPLSESEKNMSMGQLNAEAYITHGLGDDGVLYEKTLKGGRYLWQTAYTQQAEIRKF